MTKHTKPFVAVLILLLGSAMSIGAALQWSSERSGLTLWCTAQSVERLLPETGTDGWLVSRFTVDLSPDHIGHLRLSGYLQTSDMEKRLGDLHRQISFDYRRRDTQVLITVQDSGKSESDTMSSAQISSNGMFAFQTGTEMSFRVRRLTPTTYLFDNGLRGYALCRTNTEEGT